MANLLDAPPYRIFVAVGYLGTGASSEQREAGRSKLGQFYHSVTDALLRRGAFRPPTRDGGRSEGNENVDVRWRRLKRLSGTRVPNLILGGACGHGIPYARLSSRAARFGRATTLVNYYRGFEALCRKTRMVETFAPKLELTRQFLVHRRTVEVTYMELRRDPSHGEVRTAAEQTALYEPKGSK